MKEKSLKKQIEERIELSFRGCARGASKILVRSIARSLKGKASEHKFGREAEFYVLGDIVVFVSEAQIVLHASGGKSASSIALKLLEKSSSLQLESFVLQVSGHDKNRASHLKKLLTIFRAKAGRRLGIAVVSDGTAFFHPAPSVGNRRGKNEAKNTGKAEPRFSDKLSVRATFSGLLPQSEISLKVLRRSSAAVPLDSIALNYCLQDFPLRNRLVLARSYLLTGFRDGEFARLSVSSEGPASVDFSYDGICTEKAAQTLDRIVRELGPKECEIEVLHRGRILPGTFAPINGDWQRFPLGAGDTRSVLQLTSFSAIRRVFAVAANPGGEITLLNKTRVSL